MNANSLTWHYFPLNLSAKEIADPMLVLNDFFNVSGLRGHLKLLGKWRKYVLQEGYYLGRNGSPSDLLMVHLDAIRLIEAAFLLNELQRNRDRVVIYDDRFNKQLEAERTRWKHHAAGLNFRQLADPMLVITKVCKAFSLPEYRVQLHDWLIYGLSDSGCGEFLLAQDIIRVYDNLHSLYEACWLIHMRHNERMILPDQDIEHND